MTLWRSPHPDLEIPTDVTTWEWLFETEQYIPFSTGSRGVLGTYQNAVTSESLDLAQVREQAVALSTALARDYGLQPGQTVSIFSTNTIWYAVALWATIRVGGRVNGASPAYNAEEMAHALKTANTKILFTLPSSLEVAAAAAQEAGIPRSLIFLLEGTAPGFQSQQDLIRRGSRLSTVPHYTIPRPRTNKDECGYLNFSSGTTGFPKAVMLSHHNVIAQCLQLRQLQLLPSDGRWRTLAVMPLFHITGLVRFITYPAFVNGHCYMLPAFKMDVMLEAIIRYRIEELIFVPPILIRMVRDPVVDKYLDQLRAVVKRFATGAAPMSPEVVRLLQNKFPATGFRQGYGATESTACISCHPPTHFDYKYANSGGILVANTVAKVIDLTDPRKMLGPRETGEICARGPQIAMGYLGNQEATAESFDEEGFLHTGDVGYIDEEGFIHIEDRIKEMIKVKGIQVPPAELEDLLMGHELVEDCAVLGIPDEYAGERPKAFVVLKQGVPVSETVGRRLLQYVREKKVKYKWLVEIEFTESIPKGPSGKLLRRVLKLQDKDNTRKKELFVEDETRKAKL
ncbi:4-coumarate-CoA ligase 2 [Cryphonectria parasitica EP155]|uniref:4-coumarate-CoA ligase 2 n=1 Tax=Cryphonectria parasitica (strain ATCC 38755 / EP155) TaxID=660469 RepID=A0A9P4YB49_CRYP1|nr:4-coumarate-CoA ligase 2 [Cryphonectria parasitica EP155]KAF3769795.1 4-coumarate-CoA ligase 2 [Cryphonectria parasitica EP155]